MRIMITGANGQLGSELMRQLQQGKCSIGLLPEVYQMAEIYGQTFPEFDLMSKESIEKAVLEHMPDLVIHCAANTAVDRCEEFPELAHQVNAEGTRILARTCARQKARLIYISSDYVFDGNRTVPYEEEAVCVPGSAYGMSKWRGEQYAKQECAQTIVLRTAWMYGLQGKNFVKTILEKARTGQRIRVVNDQVGCPSNAEDVAYHLLCLADKTTFGTYHCVGTGSCTWFEFAEAIVKAAGILCKVEACASEEYTSRVKRPKYSVLAQEKLFQAIGSRPRPWRVALENYIKELEGLL